VIPINLSLQTFEQHNTGSDSHGLWFSFSCCSNAYRANRVSFVLHNVATQHDVPYSSGTVAAYEFNPANVNDDTKTAWVVHGWQSHSLFMFKFITPLLEQGFRVICIDLPGHGQSSGRTFNLAIAAPAMLAVRETLGNFDVILSHSLGGAVVATTLAGTLPNCPTLTVSKLVMISPPDSMTKIFNDFAVMVGLNNKATDVLHTKVHELSGRVTKDFDTSAQLQGATEQLLLIHAPDDKEVPFSESESIARHNPVAVLKPVDGLGHRRIIASDDVVHDAVSFIVA